jgi:very-short-patch-repair endonuclease
MKEYTDTSCFSDKRLNRHNSLNEAKFSSEMWFLNLINKNRMLNSIDLSFSRNHPVSCYYLDFYFPELKIGIEIDGESHNSKKARRNDSRKTQRMNQYGITVFRINHGDHGKVGFVFRELKKHADKYLNSKKVIIRRK